MTGPKSGELSGFVHLVERQMLLYQERRKLVRDSHTENIAGPCRFITISRDIGALGDSTAAELAKRLQWQVCDREIVDYIARDSRVRHSLVQQMDEKAQNTVHDTVGRLLRMFEGGGFGNEEYHAALLRSLATLAARGKIILLGHGGAFALQGQPGLHLRVTASQAVRVERLCKLWHLSPDEARRRVLQTDAERREFIRHHFKADADDLKFFNAVFNSDAATVPQIATAVVGMIQPLHDMEGEPSHAQDSGKVVFKSSEDLSNSGLRSESAHL